MRFARAFSLLALLTLGARADVPLAGNVLDPKSVPEAWNVIQFSTGNVERLIAGKRLTEIPMQIALCSPALRALARMETTPEGAEAVTKQSARLQGWVNAVARTSIENNQAATEDGFKSLRQLLQELAQRYDPKIVAGVIYFCPTHPEVVATEIKAKCDKCGAAMFKRHIPYSFIYTTPGEPSITMTAKASAPIEAGKKIDVKVRLAHRDKKPVLKSELVVTHAEPIHLLIEEPSLGDYHHVHPTATDTPGEYAFSFTPRKTAPYRIWADLVPGGTGVQEIPRTDLPSAGKPGAIENTASTFTSTVEGYQFALTLTGGNHIPITAGQTRKLAIIVTGADGQPVKTLEPVMQAFAHLVAFDGDYQTVAHIPHSGSDILNPEARGGPALMFQFFPPKPGFVRLYCQVVIGGKTLYAPFNVNVGP